LQKSKSLLMTPIMDCLIERFPKILSFPLSWFIFLQQITKLKFRDSAKSSDTNL